MNKSMGLDPLFFRPLLHLLVEDISYNFATARMDVKPGLSPTAPAKVGNILKDNIERGAAKSTAPLPTGLHNITGTTEVLAESLSQYYSRHRGVFEFPQSSKDKGHKLAKSTSQKMADCWSPPLLSVSI